MSILWLSLLGGWIAADNVSFVQSMVSRPLPAGILAGLVLGDPMTGAEIGALLEIFLLVAIPAGGGRMPEGGTATVVAVAGATSVAVPGGLALGAAAGLLWGVVAGWTQARLRVWNGAHVPLPGDAGFAVSDVRRAITLGLGVDVLRGIVLVAVGALVAVNLVPALAPHWPVDGGATPTLLLLGGLMSVGILLRGGGRRTGVLFVGGALVGLLAGWGA